MTGLIDPQGIVQDLRELIEGTGDGAVVAVRAYLYRTVAEMALAELAAKHPARAAEALTQTGRGLQASLTSWSGDVDATLPALAGAVEAVAEAIGAAADLATQRAKAADASPEAETVADRAAGAYDALVGASHLLRTPEGVSTS